MVPSKAVAKRSPILGYNHNVRYRGLVFHVQTEDSGVLSPHLFTHLFHEGVIVSTRKLVYDAGASPEAIKALMQAQHKAVLKDLNKGVFDLKIDQYLAGTPGLEPRSPKAAAAAEEPAADAHAAPAGAGAGADGEPDDHGDEVKPRRRVPRDTMVDEKTAPAKADTAGASDESPTPRPSPPPAPPRPTVGTVPPIQTPSRPTMTPVVARPVAPAPRRADSDAVEIHAPALPSVESMPNDARTGGAYGLKRTSSPAIATPGSNPQTVRGIEPAPNRPPTPPPVAQRSATVSPPLALPRTATLPRAAGLQNRSSMSVPPPVPPRSAAPAAPQPRASAPAAAPNAGANVVMTRPAVIVGAPAKSSAQRARVVPEEPSRPFSQALISEKSLDEVIHAYLSDDGEEP